MISEATDSLRSIRFPSQGRQTLDARTNPKISGKWLAKVAHKLASLQMEGLALYLPLPEAERFHSSMAKFRIVEGSNRSGKTNGGCCELARALTGTDPYDKYPKHGGVALVVGLKEDNIALLWRKLAQPGAFKIIRDEQTRLWRSVRPDPNNPDRLDPYDDAYREQWRDAPPLLPPRLLPKGSIAWNDAANGVPRCVKIDETGWRMEMRPSGSRPDQGDHYNVVLNDEEMDNPAWYDEEVRGLTALHETEQHNPRMIWTATSQVANPAFAELREKADANVPGFERFVFLIANNPYVSPQAKAEFFEALREDERATRYHGIPAMAARYIYGTYEPNGIHGCDPFEIPPNWTRYATVDPGTENCATLLVAIDPDEKHIWFYEGFVLKKADHAHWARELKQRECGVRFEAILMDSRAGCQHSLNHPRTTAHYFAAAMKTVDLNPRIHGPMEGFIPGNPDVKARTMAMRNAMALRPDGPFAGTPLLQVFKGKVAALDKEIKSALSDRKDPEKRDKKAMVTCDMLDVAEYIVSYKPHYHETESIIMDPSEAIYKSFLAEKHKKGKSSSSCFFD